MTEQDESFEDLLTDLETSKRTIQKEQEEIAAYKRELERLKMEVRQKQEKLEESGRIMGMDFGMGVPFLHMRRLEARRSGKVTVFRLTDCIM